ncbi:MAG: hypothetical protein PHV11_06130 [Candidatus Bipolaricaulis sp.]|jgi:hypothetical protein|nr:hypothetical protein [Candidatus Bipolaricaulis sp.]
MNLTKIHKIVTVDGAKELDFLDNPISSFEMRRTPAYYRVVQEDIGVPDLISWKNYNTERYWQVILVANKIISPFDDLEVGDIIMLPNLHDITEFYQKYKIRR